MIKLTNFLADLSAAVAVWLTSSEAAFLAGRFIWASWDVNELKARAEEIRNGRYLLKLRLVGRPHENVKKEITNDFLKLKLVGSSNDQDDVQENVQEDVQKKIAKDLFELEGETKPNLITEKEDIVE